MAERGPRGVGTMARTGRVQATISFRVGGVERASASLYRNISVTQRPRLESGLAPRNVNLAPNKLRVNSFGSSIDQSPPKSTFSRPGVENRFSREPFVEIG